MKHLQEGFANWLITGQQFRIQSGKSVFVQALLPGKTGVGFIQ